MSSHIIASLAEASRRNRVYEVPEFGECYQTSFGRDWHHPSFDFSRVLDALDVNEQVQAVEDFIEAGVGGTINLPFPECLYISKHKSGDVHVLRLIQSADGIAADAFIWSIAPHGKGQAWYRAPVHFCYVCSTGVYTADWRISDQHPLARDGSYDVISERLFMIVAVGTAVLGRHIEQEVQSGGQALRATNSGRERSKLRPIPEIITISLGKRHFSQKAQQAINTDRVPCRPHNRRAHYRHLRSGKVISVRASAIHGGGDPRHFQIIP
jgi:hypothetical protein